MSYILEALKKSEQERQIGNVPGLATSHRPAATRPRRRRWFWPLVALLAVNAGLMMMLFNYNPKTPDIVAETPPPAPVPPVARVAPVPEPSKPVPQPVSPKVVEPKPKPMPKPEPVVAKPVAPPPKKVPAPSRPAPKVATAPKKTAPPRPVVKKQPRATAAAPSATRSLATAQKNAAQIPEFRDLPESERAKIPIVRLDVHVYDPDPDLRFVLINLEKYREGDVLKEGPELQQILPSGIVLSYHDKRYRLLRP